LFMPVIAGTAGQGTINHESISDTLRTEREGITEFLDTLEPKVPGAAKRNPNDFIDESVLEEVLKGR
jgi:hypothetical protein